MYALVYIPTKPIGLVQLVKRGNLGPTPSVNCVSSEWSYVLVTGFYLSFSFLSAIRVGFSIIFFYSFLDTSFQHFERNVNSFVVGERNFSLMISDLTLITIHRSIDPHYDDLRGCVPQGRSGLEANEKISRACLFIEIQVLS